MKLPLLLLGAFAAWGAGAVDWDSALIRGTTPGGKMFYEPGEEMAFSLILEGAKGEIPADTYFLDWERRGDDGLVEKGRAPLPVKKPFVLRTKTENPGFVCVEANVVTKDGKRVPKNHRWEKRVFFKGGAGVAPFAVKGGKEPADYETFWQSVEKELAAVTVSADRREVPCADKKVRLYAVRIACAGGRPVTGYLTVPVAASVTNRMPILACYRGATTDEMAVPKGGPHDRIRMEINVNGYDLGRGEAYIKEFFKSISKPGYSYGFDSESNANRETSYWKGVTMRAIRYLEWLVTLPEWDGKTLEVYGGSQGGWQAIMAASRFHRVTRLRTNGTWGCDWTGQDTLGRLKSTYRPATDAPALAYYDPIFAARRVTCPVAIEFAGMGDYISPPSSLTALYNALQVPKKITYVQGETHGWRPGGDQTFTVDGGYDRAVESQRTCLDPNDPVACSTVRLKGPLGAMLDRMTERHVGDTDVDHITACFQEKTERKFWWQTEFWGKYMHAAVPFAEYSGSPKIRADIERSIDRILASQKPCGYIGNYPDDLRLGEGWDVWGIKYTLLGLLHYYDSCASATRRDAALSAEKRLCDYVIAEIGPNGRRGRELWQTGNWSGFASSSILEPVVWLYRRTGEEKYLDFASFVVRGMSEPAKGPRLIDLALKGVSVADRNDADYDKAAPWAYVCKYGRGKAYEMMSCYQGLLEYVEELRRKKGAADPEAARLYRATLLTVRTSSRKRSTLRAAARVRRRGFTGRRSSTFLICAYRRRA